MPIHHLCVHDPLGLEILEKNDLHQPMFSSH